MRLVDRGITASATARLLQCGYWCREDVTRVSVRAPELSRGTLGHAYLEDASAAVRNGLTPPAAEGDPAFVAACARGLEWLESEEARSLEWREEVAFALDLETGQARELQRGEHRDYSGCTATEIAGTADLVAVRGDTVYVYDWKFGMDTSYAGPQLATLGIMAARAFGLPFAVVGALSVGGGEVKPSMVRRLDSADFAFGIVQLRSHAFAASGEPVAGPECKYCPARDTCPIFESALLEAQGASSKLVPVDGGYPLTAAPSTRLIAAYQLPRLRLLKRWLDHKMDEMKNASDEFGGIPTGDGKAWVRCTRNQRRMVADPSGETFEVLYYAEREVRRRVSR